MARGDAENPIKVRARQAVERALKRGDLERQPCEICGESKTHGHHDDYRQPLVVRWLCNSHHRQWHRDNGEGLGAPQVDHKPTPRRRCKSNCKRCLNYAPKAVDWCAVYKREPYGLCEKFSLKPRKKA